MKENFQVGSIFDAFNARALNPIQVADTFVPPKHYNKLIKPIHSILIGPRGSGKTTLLKMLQAPALESWKREGATEYRSRIDYTGVFVPTDIGWSEQIKALNDPVLGVAAFTTQVLRTLVDAVEYRVHPPEDSGLIPHRRVALNKSQEKTLVNEVARHWHLRVPLPSLLSLKYALTARLATIKELSNREHELGPEGRTDRLAPIDFLYSDFLTSALILIEIFNDLAQEPGKKWALLFDELELAPQSIREVLVKSLRSVDARFLFKLSISPYGEDLNLLESATSAMAGHDYEAIPLWYPQKEDGYEFCNALFKSMLDKKHIEFIEPSQLFGKSEFDGGYYGSGSKYFPGSRLQARVARMAQKDPTFRKYLLDKGVEPTLIHELKEDERASVVRKITPLIAVRDTFRTFEQGRSSHTVQIRSRKNPELYFGAKTLFAVVEGNPRLFIGIIGNLLDGYQPHQRSIRAAKQGIEVRRAANRFRALLKTIPCPSLKSGQKPRGVLSIIDLMGRYIFKNVVLDDFNPDPVGSFIVDSHLSIDLIDSLGRALNAGAIVYVPDDDTELLLGSLRGKRFRLSYLLAPTYGIPIRLGRAISLSSVLATEGQQQPQLFYDGINFNE